MTSLLKKEVRMGESMPKWYGVAYWEVDRPVSICYPIPLNVVMATWRATRLWLKFKAARGLTNWIGEKEKHDRFARNVGMLRQWLNEDRISDPQRMITNEDIYHWLNWK